MFLLFSIVITMPAFADVEFRYGGSFRARWLMQENVFDGTNTIFSDYYNSEDNRSFVDQRLRLNFTFSGSKNLKLVTAFEMGDAIWGQGGTGAGTAQGNTGENLGANLGGDAVSIEVKNVFINFNIPNTPITGIVGLQPLVLLDSWIIGDDVPAALLVTNLDPFKIALGFIRAQKGLITRDIFDVDDFFLSIDYASGPFKASLIGLTQLGNDTAMSIDPATLVTPLRDTVGVGSSFVNGALHNNILVDLGLNLTYKVDSLLAYVNFVQNLGGADFRSTSVDYTGFMVDAGATYFCGPWTANLGGFYTSGPEIANNVFDFEQHSISTQAKPFRNLQSREVDWFTYPAGVQKATSEIIGGGILGEDLYVLRGYSTFVNATEIGNPAGAQALMWRGWYNPMNLWTITAGGSYQATPTTKISASYWYWGVSEDVPVAATFDLSNPANFGKFEMSGSIGHEVDVYVDQRIVDGLTLTVVGAYLFADDAFAPYPAGLLSASEFRNPITGAVTRVINPWGAPRDLLNFNSHGMPISTKKLADDAFEVGIRLQWNF